MQISGLFCKIHSFFPVVNKMQDIFYLFHALNIYEYNTYQNLIFFKINVLDEKLMTAIKNKDIAGAKESLMEVERIVGWVKAQKRDDVLIIITGAESTNIEFPTEGKEWAEFEKSGKNIIYRNSSLMSPVMAVGPMSENFCGLFDESEMLKRVMYRPERKQFDWDLVNPFTN